MTNFMQNDPQLFQPFQSFTLKVVAVPGDDRPPTIRLRALLKFALRALRLRCTEARSDPVAKDALPP